MSRTIGVGQHARGVAHGLGHGLRALVVHLLTGNHRHRLRGFQNRRTGLGRDLAVGGVVAFHAAQRITQGELAHFCAWQRQRCVLWLSPQHKAAAILADGLQARAVEQLAQRLVGGVTALQAWRLQALGHLRGARQGDLGLAGELVEHIIQGAGGDVVLLADTARLRGKRPGRYSSNAQGGAEQRGADGLTEGAARSRI
ncbi:hypothetical protein D3C85_1261480 [compost metagenome]